MDSSSGQPTSMTSITSGGPSGPLRRPTKPAFLTWLRTIARFKTRNDAGQWCRSDPSRAFTTPRTIIGLPRYNQFFTIFRRRGTRARGSDGVSAGRGACGIEEGCKNTTCTSVDLNGPDLAYEQKQAELRPILLIFGPPCLFDLHGAGRRTTKAEPAAFGGDPDRADVSSGGRVDCCCVAMSVDFWLKSDSGRSGCALGLEERDP